MSAVLISQEGEEMVRDLGLNTAWLLPRCVPGPCLPRPSGEASREVAHVCGFMAYCGLVSLVNRAVGA
jgi:hypothetical protein